jgi:hypothetical protein
VRLHTCVVCVHARFSHAHSFGDALPKCGQSLTDVVNKFYGGAVGIVLTFVTFKVCVLRCVCMVRVLMLMAHTRRSQ